MKLLKYLLIFLLQLSQAFILVYGQVSLPIKVACIGDSITEGEDLSKEESYPEKLKLFLGTEYEVINYGVSGTTMLKDMQPGTTAEVQKPYWREDKYKEVLEWKPDIIIIKFGTNDARVQNWPAKEENGGINFYGTYVEFIKTLRKDNENVIIYVCYPLPSFRTRRDNEEEQARIIREEVIPIVKQVAMKNRVHLIDLHSVFFDGFNKGLIQGGSDLIHPTADGATLIADEVFKMIKMTYKP